MEQALRLQSIPPYPFAEIARLKAKAQAEGLDVVDFGIGDPDLPPPACVLDGLREALLDPLAHPYDESPWGDEQLVRAIVRWFADRFGVSLEEAGRVKVTIGSKEALAHTAWAFVNPGDAAIVPDPGYTVYAYNTMFAGGEAYRVRLDPDLGYLPDLSSIPASVANRAKLLYLNYPNNPTGRGANLEFLREAVAFAERYDIMVCHDAAYSEVYFGDEPSPSILQVDGAMERALEFHSFSKTFSMTGWRLGWVCGCKEGVAGLTRLKSYVDSNAFIAVQRAGAAGLSAGDTPVREMRDTYRSRRDCLIEGLGSIGWRVEPPEGTFYVWARVPPGMTSAALAETLLRDAQVLVIPGSAYGVGGEGFVRFALTMRADDVIGRIGEAVRRIAQLGLSW